MIIAIWIAIGILTFAIIHHHDNEGEPYVVRDIFFFLVCLITAPFSFLVSLIIILTEACKHSAFLDKKIFRRDK